MSFQHTIYLKRDAAVVRDYDDTFDNVKYFWCSGCRNLSSVVRHFGSPIDEEVVEFSPFQLMKLLAELTAEFHTLHAPIWNAISDANDIFLYEDEDKRPADRVAMDAYAIMRQMHKSINGADVSILDEFEEPHKMAKIINGLTKLAGDMKEDDVLVWTMG